jgi:hypothetical protein
MKKVLLTLLAAGLVFFHLPASNKLLNPRLFEGTVLEATYTPSAIKSITPVTITIAAAAGTNTQTVAVTAANSVLVFNGQIHSSSVGPDSAWVNGTITNGTTITANRLNFNGSSTYNATLIEFLGSFVKSQQCNTIALADTVASNTATISAVTTSKTMLAYTGVTTNQGSGTSLTPNVSQFAKLVLTNSTTITADRSNAIDTLNVGYCYLEFK